MFLQQNIKFRHKKRIKYWRVFSHRVDMHVDGWKTKKTHNASPRQRRGIKITSALNWTDKVPPASQQRCLSRRAGKVVDLFHSFILTYGIDLQICGKAAGWRRLRGIYSIHCGFMESPIVFILSPVAFEIPTIEQSEERKREGESAGLWGKLRASKRRDLREN